jgi:hypothetical protein
MELKLYLKKTRAGIIISWQTFEHDNNISGPIHVRSKFNVYVTKISKKKTFNVELEVNLLKLVCKYVEIKGQLDETDWFLLQNLLFAQHVSGTIMPIIRSSRVIQMAAACGGFAGYCSISQTGRITHNSTPDQRPVNQRAKYHGQQPSV